MGIFNKKPKTAQAATPKTRADFTRQASERTLAGFRAGGVVEYKIRTRGDGRVCADCKKQNGKKYNTVDAVIGKNTPPFCEECRCVILPLCKGIKMPWG